MSKLGSVLGLFFASVLSPIYGTIAFLQGLVQDLFPKLCVVWIILFRTSEVTVGRRSQETFANYFTKIQGDLHTVRFIKATHQSNLEWLLNLENHVDQQEQMSLGKSDKFYA